MKGITVLFGFFCTIFAFFRADATGELSKRIHIDERLKITGVNKDVIALDKIDDELLQISEKLSSSNIGKLGDDEFRQIISRLTELEKMPLLGEQRELVTMSKDIAMNPEVRGSNKAFSSTLSPFPGDSTSTENNAFVILSEKELNDMKERTDRIEKKAKDFHRQASPKQTWWQRVKSKFRKGR